MNGFLGINMDFFLTMVYGGSGWGLNNDNSKFSGLIVTAESYPWFYFFSTAELFQ